MSKLLCLDTNNLVMRAHYTGADPLAMIQGAIRRHQPTHVVCARDPRGPTWRHGACSLYKANRAGKDGPSSGDLVDVLEPRLKAEGFAVVCVPGYEADDALATLAMRAWEHGTECLILSRDKDLFQVSDVATILWPEKGEEQRIGAEMCFHRLGVWPHQVPMLKALAGDDGDNIPRLGALRETKVGPKFFGFTEKRAAELLKAFGILSAVLDWARVGDPDEINPVEREWLTAGRERALLNQRLATLCTDVPLEIDPRLTRVK